MNRGFTLLEVVIAILILSFATLAVIAMQTGTLKGFISIRDNDEAVQIAHRTADLIGINALSWRNSPGQAFNFTPDPYGGAVQPFDVQNPLASINTTRWTWIPLFDFPVDARMANTKDSGGNTTGGRHCVYVRGGPFEGGFLTSVDGGGDVTDAAAMQVQIVVLSAGPNGTLSSCTSLPGSLALSDLDLNDGSHKLGANLEIEGLRPTYYATTVYRRELR